MNQKNRVEELFIEVRDNANHYTKCQLPKLYGLAGNDFVKAYVEAKTSEKAGFTDSFTAMARLDMGCTHSKSTTIERHMRNCFAKAYQWIKRTKQP